MYYIKNYNYTNQNNLIDSTDPLKLNFIDCRVRYTLS